MCDPRCPSPAAAREVLHRVRAPLDRRRGAPAGSGLGIAGDGPHHADLVVRVQLAQGVPVLLQEADELRRRQCPVRVKVVADDPVRPGFLQARQRLGIMCHALHKASHPGRTGGPRLEEGSHGVLDLRRGHACPAIGGEASRRRCLGLPHDVPRRGDLCRRSGPRLSDGGAVGCGPIRQGRRGRRLVGLDRRAIVGGPLGQEVGHGRLVGGVGLSELRLAGDVVDDALPSRFVPSRLDRHLVVGAHVEEGLRRAAGVVEARRETGCDLIQRPQRRAIARLPVRQGAWGDEAGTQGGTPQRVQGGVVHRLDSLRVVLCRSQIGAGVLVPLGAWLDDRLDEVGIAALVLPGIPGGPQAGADDRVLVGASILGIGGVRGLEPTSRLGAEVGRQARVGRGRQRHAARPLDVVAGIGRQRCTLRHHAELRPDAELTPGRVVSLACLVVGCPCRRGILIADGMNRPIARQSVKNVIRVRLPHGAGGVRPQVARLRGSLAHLVGIDRPGATADQLVQSHRGEVAAGVDHAAAGLHKSPEVLGPGDVGARRSTQPVRIIGGGIGPGAGAYFDRGGLACSSSSRR